MPDPPQGSGTAELARALASFLYPPGPEHERLAELLELPAPPGGSQHSDLLLFQVYPYASVYLSADGMKGGEIRDRTDGFWRALGRVPPHESDHLGALLGMFAALLETDATAPAQRELLRHAARTLQQEYLDTWVPVFLDAVEGAATTPFYGAWSRLLRQVLERTGADNSVTPVTSADALSPVASPQSEGLEPFVSSVLAPGRSGMVITRREIERQAHVSNLGLRIGTRAETLEALLRHASDDTLGWLRDSAVDWQRRHLARQTPTSLVWAGRAAATAEVATGALTSFRQRAEQT